MPRLLCLLAWTAVALGAPAAPASESRKAAHIPLQGRLDDFLVESFHRRLSEAMRVAQPSLVVFELSTQAAAVRPALALAKALDGLRTQRIETVALLKGPGSASDTLLALACDRLFAAQDARLVPLAPTAFEPAASEAERKRLAEAVEAFSARRPRLRVFYQALVDPSLEVYLVAFEGREDRPAFYPADDYRKLLVSPPSPVVRAERVFAPGVPPKLGAAELERFGVSDGTLKNAHEVAARLGVPLPDLLTFAQKTPPGRPGEAPGAAEKGTGEERPKPRAEPAPGSKVAFIALDGMVGEGMLYSVRRRLATARSMDAALVVFEMNTLGGALHPALKIADLIFEAKDVPTVAWVNREAISAGALISVACDEIVMQESSVMGDSAVVSGASGEMLRSEKIDSYLRARFLNFCEGKYPGALVEAMVTVDTEVYELERLDGGRDYLTATDYENLLRSPEEFAKYRNPQSARKVLAKGKLLTMNEKQALRYGFSSATIRSREELLDFYGLAGREMVDLEWTWSEKLVRWLDIVGPFLLSLGVLGILIELKTQGSTSGLFAAIGLAFIALFFFSSRCSSSASTPRAWPRFGRSCCSSSGCCCWASRCSSRRGSGCLAPRGWC